MGLLPGVYLAKKNNGALYFRSSVTYRNKHISLGSYPDESAAHNAYLLANRIIKDRSYTIESYAKKETLLAFEKWVVLINFRDNGYYFKTPIYLRYRYFEYHLSPQLTLKFAADDLFYYANHKIMKRGGHYFVADYGMQVNILSRYGIKNFAVCGKDYLFMNGDVTDFRYENISIINKYYGVEKGYQKTTPIYTSKIHINGDYIIGRYHSEEEAAIAYNKAAKTLIENGLNKNYSLNFISGMTKEDYEEHYARIVLPKKIRKFIPT